MVRAIFFSIMTLCAMAGAASERPETAAEALHPTLLFQGNAILATGNTSGGNVVLFGVTRQPAGFAAVTIKRGLIAAADGGGTATFTFTEPVSRVSIFAAVDIQTGAYTIATPPGYPLRLTTFPIKALRKSGAVFQQADLNRIDLEVLCVRPKKGAWQLFLTDGSGSDTDGATDGKLTLDAASFELIGSAKDSLKDFKEHDVIIIIDPMAMDVMATEVPQ
jgi:hypothetical protein